MRKLASAILENCGFHVLTAVDAGDALLPSDRHPGPIDVLVSDIVMPGMRGPELARRMKKMRPEIKVLFISGYVQTIREQGILDPADCLSAEALLRQRSCGQSSGNTRGQMRSLSGS